MTFTVTYRGADGAPVTEAVEAASRAECLAQMKARGTKGQKGLIKQLTKYSQEWADVILLEFADSVEEKSFTFRERKSVSKFCLQEFNGADKIRHLKEPISFRRNIYRKCCSHSGENPLENRSHLRLSIVIVHLDAAIGIETVGISGKVIGYLPCQSRLDCGRRIAKLFVDAKGVISNWCATCESNDAPKEFSAKEQIHCGERFLATDERSRMYADIRISQTGKLGFEFRYCGGNVVTLIMEYERNKIEARRCYGRVETSRLVHEHAQLFFSSHNEKKLAGNYPRLRVARVYTSARKLLPQLARIIANDGIECKRGLSFDEVKEAA